MKVKKNKFRRIIAFSVALAVLGSATAVAAVLGAENAGTNSEVVMYADDYTSLMPGLTSPKMKLSDPVFSEKDWYEYIEYEFYTEVVDGNMTYRIYKPTDFGEASIMAIGDYNPSVVLGNTTNLSMNLGELQGIFDMAQQGSNISKDFVGLNIANGIASNMDSIGEVMDNSKYYSKSSFLGIPGDKKYSGVSNDGFFNADSLEIEIVESEIISMGKTIAIDSSYSVSDVTENGKSVSTYNEVMDASSSSHEESTSHEDSNTSGDVTVKGENTTTDTYDLKTTLENDVKKEWVHGINEHLGGESEFGTGVGGYTQHITYDVEQTNQQEIVVVPKSETQKGTVESKEKLDYKETSDLHTNTDGSSSSDSSSVEHALTSGNENGVTYSNAKEMASSLGYGVDYQYGNEHSLSVGVTRIFNAREDKQVKNVGWKLCEYIVKVPYYIEAVKTDESGDENILYGQYVNYNLLNGVCRVFANGFIEHWYTGELVTYADFFDGFVTASELVDKAKAQQAEKADSLN